MREAKRLGQHGLLWEVPISEVKVNLVEGDSKGVGSAEPLSCDTDVSETKDKTPSLIKVLKGPTGSDGDISMEIELEQKVGGRQVFKDISNNPKGTHPTWKRVGKPTFMLKIKKIPAMMKIKWGESD